MTNKRVNQSTNNEHEIFEAALENVSGGGGLDFTSYRPFTGIPPQVKLPKPKKDVDRDGGVTGGW